MVARSRSTCHYSTSIGGMIQNRKLQSTSWTPREGRCAHRDGGGDKVERRGGERRGERIDPHERKHETRRRDLASRGIKTWTRLFASTTTDPLDTKEKTGQRLSNSDHHRCAFRSWNRREYLLRSLRGNRNPM